MTKIRKNLSESPVALAIDEWRNGDRITRKHCVTAFCCSPEEYKKIRRLAKYRGHRNLSAVMREAINRLFYQLHTEPGFPEDHNN